jgi:hypothetical protein
MYFSAASAASAAIKLIKNAKIPVPATLFMHLSLVLFPGLPIKFSVARVLGDFHPRGLCGLFLLQVAAADSKPVCAIHTHSCFTAHHKCSTKMLSWQRPRPSILIAIP